MNRKFAGALAALIVLAVPRIANAADFFLMDIDTETDKEDPTATVLDPASIVVESDGSRTFRFAIVHDVGEISDFTMEADCSALRWRQTHSSHTSMLGEVTENDTPDDWETLQDGTNGAYMHKTVCDYPSNQPTGDQVYQASDYQTAIKEISDRLTDMAD